MKHLFTIILIFTSQITYSQSDKSAIKDKAVELAEASVKSDWGTVIKYTYPKIIQMVGGEDKMIQSIENGIELQKINFESVDIGEPGAMYQTGDKFLFSLVPQTIIFSIPDGKIKTESHLLAISENAGKNWYFIDTAQLTMDNVQTLIPNYNMDLVLPEWKAPIKIDN